MYQGDRQKAKEINTLLPEAFKTIDAIILSHGHLDHCGRLPNIVKQGYNKPIYCTPATAEVARIVMMDSAKIQEEDADYLNQRARGPNDQKVQPLYGSSDAAAVLKLWNRVPYGQKTDIGKGVAFTFYDAGHILGSVLRRPRMDRRRRRHSCMLFTADVGRYDTPIIRDPQDIPGRLRLRHHRKHLRQQTARPNGSGRARNC